ncbi:MAG: hypothetical protein OXT09_31370 [Myxococcales bacterium]|nr:hypothetical protein [Myxococcales bacterium]
MAFADSNPDSLAKKFFVVTMCGVVAYVAFVLTMLSAPDKAETEQEDYGVTVAHN